MSNANEMSKSLNTKPVVGCIDEDNQISTTKDDDTMTFDEVVQFFRAKESWVYDHLTRTEPIIPHYKIGGHFVFSRKELIEFVRQYRRTEPTRKSKAAA